jgi:flavin-dependent dehydrogenase
MNNFYDLAIIGAGPAGATLARELAREREDMKIILIDGQSADTPKPCGGLLAPDAQKALARFGLTLPTSVLSDPQIFAVETIDLGRRLVRYYQRHYLNMDRYSFDKWLISLIPPSVEISNGRCISVTENDEIFTLKLHGGREIESKAVVGADGASSILRRSLFAPCKKKYIAIQQHFENDVDALPAYSCIFDQKTSDSCSWSIRKSGSIIFGGAFDIKNGRAQFDRQKARLEEFYGVALGEPTKTEACLVCSPRRFRDFNCGRSGAYLVGEAAGFISSSSFEGISSAMLSGKLLADALSSAQSPKSAIKSYRKKCRKLQLKLSSKILKRAVLCSPFLRRLIMKSGIASVEKYNDNAYNSNIYNTSK